MWMLIQTYREKIQLKVRDSSHDYHRSRIQRIEREAVMTNPATDRIDGVQLRC